MISAKQRILCHNRALGRLKNLQPLLGAELVTEGTEADMVCAWGRKPSAVKDEALAKRLGLPLLRLEDGFLRSVGLGAEEEPLSIVLDDQGIYYDATGPSRIESLITEPLSNAEVERANTLIAMWQEQRVSKYNAGREQDLTDNGDYVLVIDQTLGDASIEYGLAGTHSFALMFKDAVKRFPHHRIIVKTHPDVAAGLKKGHFNEIVTEHESAELVGDPIHVPALLERASAVFCVTSQVGFEALLWGKPVYVYGMPFYAGWGLTQDALPSPERRLDLIHGRRAPANSADRENGFNGITLQQLALAALVKYPRYLDPETGQRCEVEQLLGWMGLQRRMRERFPLDIDAVRWSRWKRPVLQRFMQGSTVHFVKSASGRLSTVGWGAGAKADIRVEDGFIRSVGLGADLTMPQSWVIDDIGMYYDATKPSRLEQIYSTHEFSDDLRQRAADLAELIKTQRVTKYNVGQSDWQRPANTDQVILVPGQVESDASIKLGSPVVRSNLELLKLVREANPDAYVIYKPHPDVQAGLRLAGDDKNGAAEYCDEIILDQDMAWLLGQVDAVHTITSLTGFEALLRDLQVVCYGQPFYSGWGLTTDIHPCPRRNRCLTLYQLVAGALILYPSYISQATRRFTTPELIVSQLAANRGAGVAASSTGWLRSLIWLKQTLKRAFLRMWRF